MYAPWRQQREAQNAFGQWANNPDDPATRANFLGMGGANAWKVMQDRMGEQMEARKLALQERKLAADANDPELVVIDGVAFDKRTGQPKFESPYTRIIPGPDGSFYEQPRVGYGRSTGADAQPSSPAQPAAARAPTPGQVVGAFRFKGGNPRDQSAWEPVAAGGAGSGPRPFP
jgi:hypothetical protein